LTRDVSAAIVAVSRECGLEGSTLVFKRFQRGPGPGAGDAAAVELGSLFEARASIQGRIRVEDLLSAAAAVTGEACLKATGILDPEQHGYPAGAPVLSDAANTMLSRDSVDWAGAEGSVFYRIRDGALDRGYPADAFPNLADVYRVHAAGIGSAGWGWVPLSVSEDHRPRAEPLRDAYELRRPVDAVFAARGVRPPDRPGVLADAIVIELGRVVAAIDAGVAIRIVLETVNGMAKTAPMTDLAMRGVNP
jgi:hypothetical protein